MGTINENTIIVNDLGLSIFCTNSQKVPIGKWKQYQKIVAPINVWYSHYQNQGTVGIVTGKISGNLEVIDIDEKNDPTHRISEDYFKLIPKELLRRLLIQTTPNKGYHLIYRCPDVEIEGNQKLALHTNKETILETRGQGGFICTNKVNNKIRNGVFDLENFDVEIPEITKEERDLLLETARSLTRYFPNKGTNSEGEKTYEYKEPAINQFNQDYDIIGLFEKHGWEVVNEDSEKKYLLRPNSKNSVHSGYYFIETKTFFCFSTSTDFKTERPYNHFQTLQVLEGITDYKQTLRKLSELGYSVSIKKDKITSKDIAEYLNGIGVRYDTFLQDLTYNGDVIEEIDYNTIFIDMKEHFDREIPRTRFEEVIKSKYITQFNPIEDFIKKNKHRKQNDVFDMWLSGIKLKNKTVKPEYVLHFLKKWYVGMIAQALGGKSQNEYFLAFISVIQGIGKSYFVRYYILPEELQKYLIEHPINKDDDFGVMMSQNLLIVDDELDGRTFQQEETFKNILSNPKMTLRRKYDRRISTLRRKCSFAGTGNNLNIVREENDRRIIPIEVKNFDREILNSIDYTNLFIEAYHLYERGFSYTYNIEEDKAMLDNLCQDYIQPSDVGLIIDQCIYKPEDEEDSVFISTFEVVDLLTENFSKYGKRINVVTIGKILNQRGFKSIRKGKERTSGYEIHRNSPILRFPGSESSLTIK